MVAVRSKSALRMDKGCRNEQMFVRATTRRQDDGGAALTQECVVSRVRGAFELIVGWKLEEDEEEERKEEKATAGFPYREECNYLHVHMAECRTAEGYSIHPVLSNEITAVAASFLVRCFRGFSLISLFLWGLKKLPGL